MRLALTRQGRGEPLVLLHPLALSGKLWKPLADALSSEFEIFAVDLRGHGRSEWDKKPFTIADMAEDLLGVLAETGLESAHLLGMSMGGSVGLTFAGRHPDRVRTLVLADTTAWYGPDAARQWAERAERARTVPRPDQLPFQRDRWFSERFRDEYPDEVDRVSEIFLRTDSEAHAAASEAMGAMDSRPLLPRITAPTLVLVGEQDYATPPKMARAIADGIPNADLRELDGLRHLSLIEDIGLAREIGAHIRRP